MIAAAHHVSGWWSGHQHGIPWWAPVAAVLAAVVFFADRFGKRRSKDEGARLARRSEMRLLEGAGGIALGMRGRTRLRAEENASVVLMGPSQSGKTSSAVLRAILDWGERPMIVLSVKDDVFRASVMCRSEVGQVKVFDPTGEVAEHGASWSPVASSSTWSDARSIAAGLLQIGQEPAERDREPHWRIAAARYLAPLMFAASIGGIPMRTVLSWVARTERDDPRALLQGSRRPFASDALDVLEGEWQRDVRYLSSIIGTLETALDAWLEPGVMRSTNYPDITPRWLLSGPNTLYVIAPSSQQRRLQPLFGGLLTHMIDGAIGEARLSDGRLDPPLFCALDEVCNAAPLPTLDEYASSGAGQGVLLMSVIQDYSQAIKAWGRDKAATIVGNHKAMLVWAGTRDPATYEHLEKMLGQRSHERVSRTTHKGGSSRTYAVEQRPLISPHELRGAKPYTALLLYGGLPPCWVDQPKALSRTIGRGQVFAQDAESLASVRA